MKDKHIEPFIITDEELKIMANADFFIISKKPKGICIPITVRGKRLFLISK